MQRTIGVALVAMLLGGCAVYAEPYPYGRPPLEARLDLLMYTGPERLGAAMVDFLRFYSPERSHEGLGHVTPADVYDGRRKAVLQRRAAQESQTLARRVCYNRAAAMQGTREEPAGDLSVPHSLTKSQRC